MVTSITARARNPRGEGDRLRLDLLDAAAELMAETGEAVSLRAIAARAGVSPTAVYRHFDDHLDLLRAAVLYCWEEFDAALGEEMARYPEPHERLRHTGRAYVRFAMEQSGKYQVLFANKIDLGMDDQIGMSSFDNLVAMVAEILEANGDDRDPFFVAVQVHTWIHGMVDLSSRHPGMPWPSVEALLDDLTNRLGLDPV